MCIRDSNGSECESYAYGINANLCLATLLETAEDGIIISKSLANKLKYHIVETLSIEFGSENIPLNMYGDINNVKLFPEIGETIRDDAIVMATRPHNEFYCSLEDMTKVNYAFDLSLIHISEPTRPPVASRMPSSA